MTTSSAADLGARISNRLHSCESPATIIKDIDAALAESSSNRGVLMLQCLLQDYWQNQTESAVMVLAGLKPSQPKILWDVLSDHLTDKNPIKLRLLVQLLSRICYLQPQWLRTIVEQSFLKSFLQLLLSNQDAVALCYTAYSLSALLPVGPPAFLQHLDLLFTVFGRFCIVILELKERYGETHPLALHLNTAVICLFHKLYSLYPVDLLKWMNKFSKTHPGPYAKVLKPLLRHVRLHPALVAVSGELGKCVEKDLKGCLGSKDPHLVLAWCSEFGADGQGGTIAESMCPVLPECTQEFSKCPGSVEESLRECSASWSPLQQTFTVISSVSRSPSDSSDVPSRKLNHDSSRRKSLTHIQMPNLKPDGQFAEEASSSSVPPSPSKLVQQSPVKVRHQSAHDGRRWSDAIKRRFTTFNISSEFKSQKDCSGEENGYDYGPCHMSASVARNGKSEEFDCMKCPLHAYVQPQLLCSASPKVTELALKEIPVGRTSQIDLLESQLDIGSRIVSGKVSSKELCDVFYVLRNQLEFERFQRRQHAQRSRSLLGKVTHSEAMEKQLSAQKHQLDCLATEVRDQAVIIERLQSRTREEDLVASAAVLAVMTNEDSEERQEKSEKLDCGHSEDADERILRLEGELFSTKKKLESFQIKERKEQHNDEQIAQLRKELLLMRQLHQNYQRQADEMARRHCAAEEMRRQLEAKEAELQHHERHLHEALTEVDFLKGRVSELEVGLVEKEEILSVLQTKLDLALRSQNERIAAVHERYECQKKLNQGLEQIILQLRADQKCASQSLPVSLPVPVDQEIRK